MFIQDHLDEINLLGQFNLDSTQEGVKVHSTAPSAMTSAAQRLFDKGMITLPDGGYLTHRGIHAAEHAQAMVSILSE